MSVWGLFSISIALMVLGHICKIYRWGLYISIYEKPQFSNLLNAMSIGHMLNSVLPIRIGDVFRALWSGRRMKNGYAFSFATVAADLYVDVITVGMMFFGLSLLGKGGLRLQHVMHIYMGIFVTAIALTILCIAFRKKFKKAMRTVAMIFNKKIEFALLYTSYLCIASIKDIVQNINKKRFALATLGIWVGYVASYVIFAEAIQRYGFFYSTSDVFTTLFSGAGLYHIEEGAIAFWAAYLLIPLVICVCISLYARTKAADRANYRTPLPQLNENDRLAFLETYYEETNREKIRAYLEINKDVTVVKDCSAGSNASTLLVMDKGGSLLYRKYAFNEDGDKLCAQIRWIEEHQKDVPLPAIADKTMAENFAVYDMPSYGSALGMFQYIHTHPLKDSWDILESALKSLSVIHKKNRRPAEAAEIEKYLREKLDKNLQIIKEEDKYIRSLEQYETITVNGRKLKTLSFYSEMLRRDNLKEAFSGDFCADIHGDFTIENIISVSDNSDIRKEDYADKFMPQRYYFIDPGTGNVFDSVFLDYAKLLQSLHGGYEFLTMVNSVEIEENRVSFMLTRSEAYSKLYEKYKGYLRANFSKKEIRSIYFHEIIHWFRLMPYKIRKNEKMAVVFYAGMLSVLHDIWEMSDIG